MSAYIGSTPTEPLDPGTAAFVKGKPAIVETAQDIRWYKEQWNLLIKKHSSEKSQWLANFKEKGPWRGTYKTWDKCCYEFLQESKRNVDRQIAAVSTNIGQECPNESPADTLAKVNSISPPSTAAELHAQLEADMRAELEAQLAKPVVHAGPDPEPPSDAATKPATKPKANAPLENGETVADYRRTTSANDPTKDLDGNLIPKPLLSTWNRRPEVQEKMTLASKLRSGIKDLAGQSTEKNGHTDPLYNGMGWQAAISSLDSIYYQFSECRPDVVCPQCNGTLKDHTFKDNRECPLCRHVGFVSERRRTEFLKGGKTRKLARDFVASKE